MSELVLVVLGAVLCFAGAASVRLGVLVAGFAAGWLLAEVFDASLGTTLLVALCGAGLAFASTWLVATVMFLVGGGCVGAIVGAKLFVLADSGAGQGDADWLLGVVFVPTVALLGALLASRFRLRFLRWGTALAGSALVLSGVGRLGDDSVGLLWRPESGPEAALFAVTWAVLALAGHRVQSRASGQPDAEDAHH